jgi:putative transposase
VSAAGELAGFFLYRHGIAMPRIRRSAPDGAVQHVLNRGNNRATVFHKRGDYEAFLRMMREAQEVEPIRILNYTLMPNHFHLTVWPETIATLSAYMRCLMNSHVRAYHQHYGTCGHGHIWQGRFKNFPIQTEGHLIRVLRYVDANALRAGLVRRAEDWSWGSLGSARSGPELCEWPVPRPEDWVDFVNAIPPASELRKLRRSVRRGTPYGDEEWVRRIAKENGLEFTIRPPGRPRKDAQPSTELSVT